MEKCDCSLFDLINQRKKKNIKPLFSESEILTIAADLGRGLIHLHKNNIVHNDIKLGNVLVKNGVFKLTDFGLSARIGE